MAVVSVMYPATPGSRFDMEYYLNRHMRMVAEAWSSAGMRSYQVLQGLPAADGAEPVFQVVANLDFESAAAFESAVTQSGAPIMADIPNFTDVQPTIQVSDVAGTYTA